MFLKIRTRLVVRTLLFLMVMLASAKAQNDPPALAVDSTCEQYADTHTLVRNDVVKQLNSDHKKLPVCEEHLSSAQKSLTSLKADAQALKKATQEQRAVIAEYKAQKRVLESYIKKLESANCPEPSVLSDIRESWEQVDGMVALGGGYALGTGMCIGLAYVFNQPSFKR